MDNLGHVINELLTQKVSDVKQELILELSEIIKQVIESEHLLTGRDANELNRLTYSQIQEEYKISLTSLHKLKKQGLLIPICKGGKSLIFDRYEVEECLRNRPRIAPNFIKRAS